MGSSKNNGRQDLEASSSRYLVEKKDDNDEESSGVFDFGSTKNAPIERLRRWRNVPNMVEDSPDEIALVDEALCAVDDPSIVVVYCHWQAALVLNASRRFRYTLDLKREAGKEQTRRKIRMHAQVIRAAILFKEAGERANGLRFGTGLDLAVGGCDARLSAISPSGLPPSSSGDYAIEQEQLASIEGLAGLLKTNLDKGISGDDADLLKRKNAFGSNTYPRKKGRNFWTFLWDACKDLTLIILEIAAAASLALGIKSERENPCPFARGSTSSIDIKSHPIMLLMGQQERVPMPYRFEDVWLNALYFLEMPDIRRQDPQDNHPGIIRKLDIEQANGCQMGVFGGLLKAMRFGLDWRR
ncbi:hypothetical protein HHK36_021068 [Tetracentron sinense]|uniref:Cation-transporting P-type ATPase N-terminal domain-containing protein n=1 Tax=Tetracentron sinense TaxID=13715 RepID=A0A834YP71_TETSI|nr:hypothetical protein HHK36_021068 [Tetracentron sinense]